MPQVSCVRCSRVLQYSGDQPSFCGYCGQALVDSAPDQTQASPPPAHRGDETIDFVPRPRSNVRDPDLVKGYRLIRQLGKGGMGTVYEAEDLRVGRKVALKIIAPGYVDSQGAVERFRLEGRLASTLAHPRCVFVLEADEDEDGRPFIAMELMTGDTLQDLVEKAGQLPVGDAVAKILDVIEGLREAHRLGLIHRDVKPSNCFLDGEGRVKVGDFGLSKSQATSANLTRSGSFLGTPLYASPEQIKVETLDGRTDVYSTAATLFYLLTGRAPFDRGDASATMARIVTDPAPSAREKRPEVPIGLDRAIRKGLERDRDRRYADLDQLRAALVAYLPGHVSPAKPVLRVGAYLFDLFVLGLLTLPLTFLEPLSPWIKIAIGSMAWLIYFGVGDGLWGGTPGKRLLRLRVADEGCGEGAGLTRGGLRSLVFYPLVELPVELFTYLDLPWDHLSPASSLAMLVFECLGVSLMAFPFWTKKRSQGLHDLIAGTRVVELPRAERRRSAEARRAIGRDRGSVTRPIGVMKSVGPYKVRGAVRWEADRRVVAGEDSSLGREVWIVLRPKGSAAPEWVRREVTRATRPRWLDGGEQSEGRWDAYIAPAGCPLSDLAGPEGLSWHDARPILEDMADELSAACADGTLPVGLTVDQVWVQPDGRAILVDSLSVAGDSDAPDHARALSLLRHSAALALEGGRRRGNDEPKAIRSPVPLHALETIRRLLGGEDAHTTVDAFRSDLETSRNLPTEVGIGPRATGLGIMSLFVSVGLSLLYLGTFALLNTTWLDEDGVPIALGLFGPNTPFENAMMFEAWLAPIPAIVWIIWDFLTQGGFSLRLAGLGLVRWDGRPAPRWRCAWRSFLVWAPPTALLVASVFVMGRIPNPNWARWIPFFVSVASLPVYVVLALVFPSCGPHDRLSGLRVVPR
ncbi:protein kinase domain-containing protein [Tundrisphaera lichenicola]|uniref:protein kinase domain-containing protein n=1 Tax=Tundrisphaera lichenicola TaxID=2029860 RepID=UPI003EB7079F